MHVDKRNSRASAGDARQARWTTISLAVAIALAWMQPQAVFAQDADLPKAEVLLDKMVEAIGGKAAHEKI